MDTITHRPLSIMSSIGIRRMMSEWVSMPQQLPIQTCVLTNAKILDAGPRWLLAEAFNEVRHRYAVPVTIRDPSLSIENGAFDNKSGDVSPLPEETPAPAGSVYVHINYRQLAVPVGLLECKPPEKDFPAVICTGDEHVGQVVDVVETGEMCKVRIAKTSFMVPLECLAVLRPRRSKKRGRW